MKKTIKSESILEERIKELEEKIKNQQYFYEGILSLMPGHVYWLNKNNVYMGCNNQQAYDANLKSREEIIGKTNAELPWQEQAEELDRINKLVLKTGKSVKTEEIANAHGSIRSYLTEKIPLRDKEGNINGLLGISMDITSLKEKEIEIQKARERAENANRAKSAFIANMSHDIRTPLTGIIGLSGILEEEVTEPEQKETAHMLNISGEQLLSLLNSVLDIVASDRIQEKKVILSAFNLEDLLHNIFELELPALQLKSIALKLHMDEAIPKIIESDKGKIYRILLNLISNAIKFTTEGSITLSIKALEQKKDKTLLEFEVQDTGIGIDEKDKERIFDKFFRAIPSYEGKFDGHGVGLAIVKQYIEALKGRVSVDSQLNKGTTVTVTIPIKALSEETIPVKELEKELCQPSQNSEKLVSSSEKKEKTEDTRPFVLLVEDNPMAMKIASLMLSKANCRFLQAVNGSEALELVKINRFDWIISDIGLPDFSGFVLAKKIADYEKTKGLPLTPIVGLTAHAKEEALKHSGSCGMKTVFEKPLKAEAVQSLIQQYFSADKTPHEKHENSISQKAPVLTQNLPLFEFDKAIEQVGNKQTVIELIEYMLNEELTKSLEIIDAAYQKKDWEQFKALVHKFKSSCLYCATTTLLDVTQKLENTALLDDNQQKEALYQTFQQSCEKTKAHLQTWLKDNQS
ncbi:TPA: ATP-binding protein [Legionella pneumophila]|nr:response regulator [Legionella pneumophila]